MLTGLPTARVLSRAVSKKGTDPKKFIALAVIATIINEYAQEIEYWENYGPTGMIPPHTLNSDPKYIDSEKRVQKILAPAYFKGASQIDEREILSLRSLEGTPFQAAKLAETIKRKLNQLNIKIDTRIEWMIWQAIFTGKLQFSENGVTVNAEYGIPANQLNVKVSEKWSVKSSAQPIPELEQFIRNWFNDKGYTCGWYIMNSTTAAKVAYAEDTRTYYSGAGINEKPMPGNLTKYLPEWIPNAKPLVFDGGYFDSATKTFKRFIPDNKVALLGEGKGRVVNVRSVSSLHNTTNGQPAPGKFVFLIDKSGQKEANPHVDFVGGFYGITCVEHPEEIVVIDTESKG